MWPIIPESLCWSVEFGVGEHQNIFLWTLLLFLWSSTFPWEPRVIMNNFGSWAELLIPPEQGIVVGSQFLWCSMVSAEPDLHVASWWLQMGFPGASTQTSLVSAVGGKWNVEVFMSIQMLFKSFTPGFGRFVPRFPVRLHCQGLQTTTNYNEPCGTGRKDENHPLFDFCRASASVANLLRPVK